MYETIKMVNGYRIYRMVGTRGVYHVDLGNNAFATFRTIKAASAYCEAL